MGTALIESVFDASVNVAPMFGSESDFKKLAGVIVELLINEIDALIDKPLPRSSR